MECNRRAGFDPNEAEYTAIETLKTRRGRKPTQFITANILSIRFPMNEPRPS